jgi:hypothetical protein
MTERVGGCTHEVSEQQHVVLLDPVAEELRGGVPLTEDQLQEPGRLLRAARQGLDAPIFLRRCGVGRSKGTA